MKKRAKILFLKALLISIKSFILLPVILYVINDILDIYSYAQDKSSYSIKIFVILSLLLLINLALILFTRLKIWKILMIIILVTIYILMHYYSPEVINSSSQSICIEGNYKDCVLKDLFEEP